MLKHMIARKISDLPDCVPNLGAEHFDPFNVKLGRGTVESATVVAFKYELLE